MEWHPLTDSIEDDAALDRIDTLIANASHSGGSAAKSQTADVPLATPPVERILAAVEQLLMLGAALERGHRTPTLRTSLERVLQNVIALCDDWGFATARVRVDFIREDLKSGYADLNGGITELVRHLRYDARSWNPAHRPAFSPLRRSA